METNKKECLLCGSSAHLKHDSYPGYQEPDSFQIYHCNNCNTSFSFPEVHTSLIYESIYKNGNRVPGYNRYWRYASIVKKIRNPFSYLADSSEAYWGVREIICGAAIDKKELKILEVGSGLGYLTYSLNKANYNTTGLDISQTAVVQAKRDFGDHYVCADLKDYAELNPGFFDIVILTEVIEHISRPMDFIKSVLKLLKPQGKAFITSPNKSLYPDEIIWSTDLPPVHCWWFSEESMKYIAKALGTKVSFINFASYYKKNYKVIRLKHNTNDDLPKPFFNSNGELIEQFAREKSIVKQNFQLLLFKIPFAYAIYIIIKKYLKRFWGKARVLFDKELIVCNERGNFFCAILERP